MDLAARPNPLHDLLPQIAAFAEMQCVRLIRLLGQKALADIFPIARLAMFQPDHACCFGIGRLSAGSFQRSISACLLGHRRKDEESRAAGRVEPRNRRVAPIQRSNNPPREWRARALQHFRRFWTFHRDGRDGIR